MTIEEIIVWGLIFIAILSVVEEVIKKVGIVGSIRASQRDYVIRKKLGIK